MLKISCNYMFGLNSSSKANFLNRMELFPQILCCQKVFLRFPTCTEALPESILNCQITTRAWKLFWQYLPDGPQDENGDGTEGPPTSPANVKRYQM